MCRYDLFSFSTIKSILFLSIHLKVKRTFHLKKKNNNNNSIRHSHERSFTAHLETFIFYFLNKLVRQKWPYQAENTGLEQNFKSFLKNTVVVKFMGGLFCFCCQVFGTSGLWRLVAILQGLLKARDLLSPSAEF